MAGSMVTDKCLGPGGIPVSLSVPSPWEAPRSPIFMSLHHAGWCWCYREAQESRWPRRGSQRSQAMGRAWSRSSAGGAKLVQGHLCLRPGSLLVPDPMVLGCGRLLCWAPHSTQSSIQARLLPVGGGESHSDPLAPMAPIIPCKGLLSLPPIGSSPRLSMWAEGAPGTSPRTDGASSQENSFTPALGKRDLLPNTLWIVCKSCMDEQRQG